MLSVLKKNNEENLFLNNKEKNNWNDLTIFNKVDIIHLLCELRLQLHDIEAKFNVSDKKPFFTSTHEGDINFGRSVCSSFCKSLIFFRILILIVYESSRLVPIQMKINYGILAI